MWDVYGVRLDSRLFLGTAQFPSPDVLRRAVANSGAEVITVSLSRQMPEAGGGQGFWDIVKESNCRILPNTAGCHTVSDAVLMAQMAREIFDTTWVKLEIIGDDYTLHPDIVALCEAAKELIKQGFDVFPYCTSDLTVCKRLLDCGCRVVMPGAAPIGSGLGVLDTHGLRLLRVRYDNAAIIVDAGIGRPSDAAMIMEMGIDGVLVNSAVSRALDPALMAQAFKHAVHCGRMGYEAGIINKRDLAVASTSLVDTPFWHSKKA
ncbi:thiazole synthase [Candidatus Anaplasma sp. TIGMIC]|uniref:thiazole synthase n=1 Tax=Candidatus Anaplasma sp. TIGMIC TaxID=3020713 RepID=UPI00232E3572|nr:thiazole synthase [Candidatus Anaplasma sp. TIGMIC]MDB1135581.1 thiazole synthase [Candidatus Anaplasma sp. TIGMIC]